MENSSRAEEHTERYLEICFNSFQLSTRIFLALRINTLLDIHLQSMLNEDHLRVVFHIGKKRSLSLPGLMALSLHFYIIDTSFVKF